MNAEVLFQQLKQPKVYGPAVTSVDVLQTHISYVLLTGDFAFKVKKIHNLERTEENDELCMDLLESRAVLQYRNEKQWYNVNPLLPEPPKEK